VSFSCWAVLILILYVLACVLIWALSMIIQQNILHIYVWCCIKYQNTLHVSVLFSSMSNTNHIVNSSHCTCQDLLS
jgi:hypothetical protein